jgi:Trk K+ transport system NAD-binding subunit
MQLRSRRTVYYLALVAATTVLFTATYNVGMAVWGGRPQLLYRSLEVVIQSFTTTGYGEDAPWQTLQMNVLAILMQLTGIGLILTAVDVFAVPWLRDALAPSAPETLPDLEDHIVVCEHTPRTDAFIAELDARGRDYVLVESDTETAVDLHEAGYRVIRGDPESVETLENAGVGSARCVVVDAPDDTSASVALSVRDVRSDVRVITLVEDVDLARYHSAAGVDDVLSPRQLLGRSLAEEVPTAVATEIEEGVVIGEGFELVELTVAPESDLASETFSDAVLRDRFGVNVIGAWVDGDFETPVGPDEELSPGTRLLVAGRTEDVEALRDATAATVRTFSAQRIVIAGFGDSGRAIREALSGSGFRITVLDIEETEGVDVVGDAREPSALEESGVEDADALVLAVADDTTAIFATLIARELNPDLHIVVRANEEADVEKLRRAGADYVLSLATVSGRMIASAVLDEEVIAMDTQVEVLRTEAPRLVGQTLGEARVRSRTGCTVVAVERDGEVLTDLGPDFRIQRGDELVVAGTDEGTNRFTELLG